jgi:hypothetical protein
MDDLSTKDIKLVKYDPALVRSDVTFDWEFPLPPEAKESDGWVQVLPKGGTSGGEWKNNGVLSSFDPKKNATPSNVSVNGGTVTIGLTDKDKHYIACGSLTGVNTINVAGEAVLVISTDVINLQKLNINFVTPNAKLTVYTEGTLNDVQNIKTTQQMYYGGNKVDNWEAKRLQIVMLPKKNTNPNTINMESLNPVAIRSHVENVIKSGPDIINDHIKFHAQESGAFVGQIFAPYSVVSLDCAVTYCGSFFTNTYTVSGNCKLTFHYDESLEDGTDTEKTLSIAEWMEIVP